MTFKEFLLAEAKKKRKKKRKHRGLPIFPVGPWLFGNSNPSEGSPPSDGDSSSDGGGE